MSDVKRVLLVGATGLIGREVIAQGRDVAGLGLVALARREVKLPRGSRMELLLAPSDEWNEAIASIAPDAIICALGTTQAKSGSDGLQSIDRDLVLQVARSARDLGVRNFVLISSVGADLGSRNLYLRTKAETEASLRGLKFHRLAILRPGLLRGERQNETRVLERIGQILSPITDMFLRGKKSRYRSIAAQKVAAAALLGVQEDAPGMAIHEHDNLLRMAARFTARSARGKGPPS